MNRGIRTCGRVLVMVVVAAFTTGCLTGKEFRDVAGPSVHSGISLILDGLVDGVFAVIDPDNMGDS